MKTHMNGHWSHQERHLLILLILLILLLATFLRLYHLDKSSLWLDEIITQEYAQKAPEVLLKGLANYDDHPPLFYLIAIYERKIAGGSDFASRLPAAFADILSVAIIFTLGKRLEGWRTGLLAAILLAAWPMQLQYSQEARPYSLLMLFSLASLYFLYCGTETGSVFHWAAFTLTTVGNLYTHNFAFIWLLSQAILVVAIGIVKFARLHQYTETVRRLLLPFTLSLFASSLFYLPWYPQMLLQRRRLVGKMVLPSSSYLHFVLQKSAISFSGKSVLLLYGSLIFIALGSVYLLKARRWETLIVMAIPAAVPVLVVWILPSSHFFAARYLLPVLGPLLLLMATGLWWSLELLRLRGQGSIRRLLPALTATESIALVFLVLVFLFPADSRYYGKRKEDWRGAAAYIAARSVPGDVIIGDGTIYGRGGDARRVQKGLGYYLPDSEDAIAAAPGISFRLPANKQATGQVWGVIWHQTPLLPVLHIDKAERVAEIKDFKDVVVLQLKSPTGLVWNDTSRMLQVMVQMLYEPGARIDERLALAELFAARGQNAIASEQLHLAEEAIPKGNSALGDRIASFAAKIGMPMHFSRPGK